MKRRQISDWSVHFYGSGNVGITEKFAKNSIDKSFRKM